MTSTLTTSTPDIPTACGAQGKTSIRRLLIAQVSTATADTWVGLRVRGLIGELTAIAEDVEMAGNFAAGTTQDWLAELAVEERDVWEHLFEALTPHTA
jgi:hypothetical protein